MSNTADNLSDLLRELPRTLVGDGKTPNVHFVTNCDSGEVVALFVGDGSEMADAAIALADNLDEAHMVEDRLTGVVHDNPASMRNIIKADIAEGDRCPKCESSNVANEGPCTEGQWEITCHDCSHQFVVEENAA